MQAMGGGGGNPPPHRINTASNPERIRRSYLKLPLLWYRMQKMSVKWSNLESESFPVPNDVRQGSCLSPMLFNVYIDDLLHMVQHSKVGCRIGQTAVNILAYADDLIVLSPSGVLALISQGV